MAFSYSQVTAPQGAVPTFPVHPAAGRFSWPADQVESFTALITQPRAHVLENEYTRVTARALNLFNRVQQGFSGVTLTTRFPAGNTLADQLKGVATLIGARAALGVKRQVFMVSLGGFDHHDGLMNSHPALLAKVSAAMGAFHTATQELGMADQVTLFTASDFGRSLSMNGNGSDHGWGGHHFIVGGAVRGAAFYGTPPPLSISNTAAPGDQWHVGQGRLLPTTSVDQYAATLATWFGVSASELPNVLPHLRNFGGSQAGINYPLDLGFMR